MTHNLYDTGISIEMSCVTDCVGFKTVLVFVGTRTGSERAVVNTGADTHRGTPAVNTSSTSRQSAAAAMDATLHTDTVHHCSTDLHHTGKDYSNCAAGSDLEAVHNTDINANGDKSVLLATDSEQHRCSDVNHDLTTVPTNPSGISDETLETVSESVREKQISVKTDEILCTESNNIEHSGASHVSDEHRSDVGNLPDGECLKLSDSSVHNVPLGLPACTSDAGKLEAISKSEVVLDSNSHGASPDVRTGPEDVASDEDLLTELGVRDSSPRKNRSLSRKKALSQKETGSRCVDETMISEQARQSYSQMKLDHAEPQLEASEDIIGEQDISCKVVESEIQVRCEKCESEERLKDGTVIRKTVTTKTHVKPITEVVYRNGVEEETREHEEVVGVEVEEQILTICPGITNIEGNDVKRKVSEETFEDVLPSGVPLKKTVINILLTLQKMEDVEDTMLSLIHI